MQSLDKHKEQIRKNSLRCTPGRVQGFAGVRVHVHVHELPQAEVNTMDP